jgi:hypothetical protein
MAYLKFELLYPIAGWLYRFVDTSIRTSREKGKTWVKDSQHFCCGKYEAVAMIYAAFFKSDDLFFVGDSVNDYQIYQYTGKITTYELITQGELITSVKALLKSAFITIPKEYSKGIFEFNCIRRNSSLLRYK